MLSAGAEKRMAKNNKNREKAAGLNRFEQYRASGAKLKRIDDEVVLGAPSNNTAADVKHDYPILLGEVRQLDQYVSIKVKRGHKPTADQLMTAFSEKTVLLVGNQRAPGYVALADLDEFCAKRPKIFDFTRDLMAKAWGLTRSTIDTLLKPNRKKPKKPKKS